MDILEKGKLRLEWAREHMDAMKSVRKELKESGVLEGVKISMALHVEAKTGILALTLQEAGAKVRLASCNPLSTDDSVAIALREEYGLETYARKGESNEEYYRNLNTVLDLEPQIVIDDGADLIFLLHTSRKELSSGIWGANEETTTGVVRLRALERSGELLFPVIDVNDAHMKHLFDNRYGTGQSTFDGIFTSTNLLIAGKTFVVAGYGWCGRGIAMRAKGLGADVIVTEVDPIKAIEARMDGFRVMPMMDAVKEADFIVSATGVKDIVRKEHFEVMKNGCVMANSGHFDNEISKKDLEEMSESVRRVRDFVDEYRLKDGRKLYLLGEGRLINLAAGQGHPIEIMDMSFSIQALSAAYIAENHEKMEKKVYQVPYEIDEKVAKIKLKSMGIEIDRLTDEQIRYINDWKEGT